MDIALLDTSVLWPSVQRDFLLSLAVEGLYEARWSEAVLEELTFHEAKKLSRRGTDMAEAEQRAARLIDAMRRAFPDATAEGWEHLEGTFGLPDPDDEHIVAAAVVAGADVIVTHNLKDFPRDKVPAQIHVSSAADFVRDAVAVNPSAAKRALQALSARYTSPALTTGELVEILDERYDMHDAAEQLRALW